MNTADRSLKDLIDRHVPSPSHLEIVASRERVIEQLRSQPAHLQTARIADTEAPASRWRHSAMLAAAACVMLAVAGSAIVWPRGERELYRVVDGAVQADDAIATGGGGAMLALADGSRVEMRSNSQLSLERAVDGLGIRLRAGGIIVNAAKQRDGHLYVYTPDMTVSVIGTVFLVDAEKDGSRVGVIEGEVSVREGAIETRLRPGEQVSTRPAPAARSLREDLAWSRNSQTHLAILDSFARGISNTAAPLQSPPGSRTALAQAGQSSAATGAREFEEATVRECDPDRLPVAPEGARGGGANSFRMTPGRTYALCMTTATLIRTAYGLAAAGNEFLNDGSRAGVMRLDAIAGLGTESGVMVRGGPDWVRSARYSIDAIADPSADAATMSRTMLRALLERRFQLKAHVEVEQIPAYTLTVAKGGVKMKRMDAGGCEERRGGPQTPPRSAAEVRRGAKPTCGIFTEVSGPNVLYVAGGVTIIGSGLGTNLARGLAMRLGGVRVIDKTGLTGSYSYIMEFAPDENTPGLSGSAAPVGDTSGIPRAPNIFAALEQQLGLKLEPATAPREYVVIDHVERPTPN